MSHSEPDFFTQAILTHVANGPIDPLYGELCKVVGNLTSDLLNAGSQPAGGRTLVKLRTECSKAPGLIVRTEREKPASIFMIREFKSWATSTLRATLLTPADLFERYVEGLQCLRWLRRSTDCLLVKYEELTADPAGTLEKVSLSLGRPLTDRSMEAFKMDAQAGTPLARSELHGRKVNPRALANALSLWAQSKPDDLLHELGLSGYC